MESDDINVHVVSSKKLLEYERMIRQQNTTWDQIQWQENPLESGSGSPDCETHLKIVNLHPAWKELFDVQRKELEMVNKSCCDVCIHVREGFIPCHRVFLQQKSELLDTLIDENLKVNMPGNNNVISITLMDVSLKNLKTVMTLLYTGTCVVADSKEENDVKAVLRLLQINVKNLKLTKEPIDPGALKSKSKKFKTVHSLRYQDVGEDIPPTMRPVVPPPSVGMLAQPVPTSSNACAAVPGPSHQIPGTSASNSSVGISNQIPQAVLQKVPPGSLTENRKPAKRIRRNNMDDKRSTSADKPCNEDDSDEDDSNKDDSDEDDEEAPPPVLQKVPEGSLIPKKKQPRIIRSVGRGRSRNTRAGSINKQTSSKEAVSDQDDENSNIPKGRYEHDSDFVPSGHEEIAGEEREEDGKKRAALDLKATDETKRPRTRKSAPIIQPEGSNSRYPKRQRRRTSSHANDDTMDSSPRKRNKSTDTLQLPDENNVEINKAARVRGKGIPPMIRKDGSSSRNSTNDENKDENGHGRHRCTFCGDTYLLIEDLKSHLEESCARQLTGTYNLLTFYCETCQTFFKDGARFTATDLMDHVKMCAYSAQPSKKRQRNSSTPTSAGTSSGTLPVKTPLPSPADQQIQTETQQSDDKNLKQKVRKIHEKSLDILGTTKVSVFVDRLQDEQINKMVDLLRRREPVRIRPNVPPVGQMYVFPNKRDENPAARAATALSAPPSSATPVVVPQQNSEIVNETPSTAKLSSFNPTYASTPLSPGASKSTESIKIKRTGPSTRPISAPLSVKTRAKVATTENVNGDKRSDKQLETKTPEPNNNGQKENIVRQGKSNSTSIPINSDTSQGGINLQVKTTAGLLREKLKSTLHQKPHTVVTMSTAKTNADENSASSNKGTTGLEAPSGLEQRTHSITSSAGVAGKTVSATEVDQVAKANKNKSNSDNTSSPSPVVLQQQSMPVTVGEILSNTIANIFQNSMCSTSPSVTGRIVPALTNQSGAPNESNQPKKGNSSISATNSMTNASENQVGAFMKSTDHKQLAKKGQTASMSQPTSREAVMLNTSTSVGLPISVLSPPPQAQQQQSLTLISQPHSTATSQTLTHQQKIQLAGQQQQIPMMQQSRAQNLPVGEQQLTSECTIRTVMTSQIQGSSFIVPQQSQQQQNRLQTVGPGGIVSSNQPRILAHRQFSQGLQDVEVQRIEVPMANPPSSNNNQPQQLYMQQGMSIAQQYPQHQRGTVPISTPFPSVQRANGSAMSVQTQLTVSPNRPASVFPQLQQQQPVRPQLTQSVLPLVQQQQQQPERSQSSLTLVQQPARSQSSLTLVQQQQQPTRFQSSLTLVQQQQQPARSQSLTLGQQQQQPTRAQSVLPMVQQQQQQPPRAQSALPVAQQQNRNTPHGGMYSSVHPQQQQFQMVQYRQQSQQTITPPPQQQQQQLPILESSQSYTTSGGAVYSRSLTVVVPTVPVVLGNIGGNSTTTVRLPVSAQMNPLANNRSIQATPQQNQHPSQMFGSVVPSTSYNQALGSSPISSYNVVQSNPNEVVVAGNNNNSATGPFGQLFPDDTRTFKCPDCGLSFKSQEGVMDHQNEGMCD